MPLPGYKQTMTENALRQRQEAPIKHGVYSKKMTSEKASTLAALEDRLSTRPGLVEVQRDQAAKAVQMANAIMAYVVKKHKDGTPLDRIPAINKLPAFMNSAQRALKQLHDMLPDEGQMLDEGVILNELRRGQNKDDGTAS